MTTANRQNPIEYLEINAHATRYKVLQRMERAVFDYVESKFKMRKYPMDRMEAVWDNFGRVRINTSSMTISKLSKKSWKEHERRTVVLSYLYKRLKTNTNAHNISIRALFYRFPDLFKKQMETNQCVVALCSILRVPRIELKLAAAPRGCICGKFKISEGFKMIYHGAPRRFYIDESNFDDFKRLIFHIPNHIKHFLIVEKHSMISELLASEWVINNCILMTTRGLPTLLGRKLLKLISCQYPTLPFWCFTDCDVGGLNIFLSYQQGTITMPESYHHALPKLMHLGIEFEDAQTYQVPNKFILNENVKNAKNLESFLLRKQRLYFERYEKKKNGLEYAVFQRIWKQLTILRKTGKKVQIESIGHIDIGNEYLPKKIDQMMRFYQKYAGKHLLRRSNNQRSKPTVLQNGNQSKFAMRNRSDSMQTFSSTQTQI